jgi:cytoskeletal protein RodZ
MVASRASRIAAAVAALVLGAGVAACGGQQVSEPVPSTLPEITVSEEDVVGLGGGADAALSDTSTTDTSTTATTPDTSGSTVTPDTSGTAVTPDTGVTGTPTPTPTPTEEPAAPATGDTGGTATPPADGTTGDTGGTGGAGFDDFCAQNPGAC